MAKSIHNKAGSVIIEDDGGESVSERGADRKSQLPTIEVAANAYSIFNAKDLLTLFRYNWMLLAIFFSVVVVGTLFYVLIATPIYQAKASLHFAQSKSQQGISSIVSIPGMMSGGSADSNSTELAIMKSRPVTSWILELMKQEAADEFPVKGLTPGSISGRMKIVRQLSTNIYQIIVEDANPKRAAFIANNIVRAYRHISSERNEEEAKSANIWIAEKADTLRGNIAVASAQLQTFQQEHGVNYAYSSNVDTTLSKMTGLQDLQSSNEISLVKIRRSIDKLDQYISSGKLVEAVESGFGGQALQQKLEDLSLLEMEEKNFRKIYMDQHPKLHELGLKRETVFRSIKRSLTSSLNRMRLEEENQQEVLKRLEAELSQIKTAMADDKANALMRQLYLDRKMLETLLEKEKELEFIRSLQNTSISMLEGAQIPGSPFKPRRYRAMGLALILGVFGGIAIVIIIQLMRPTILSDLQMETYLGVPVIKSVEKIKLDETNDLNGDVFLFKQKRNPKSEIFRYIRTHLEFLLNDNSKMIMICSPEASDGKSFVSLNLATAFALGGKKTLLLELDLRRPRLSRIFKHLGTGGLADYFRKQKPLDECTIQTQFYNFDILLSGYSIANPLEIMGSRRFKELIAEIRSRYDIIIVDTPKLLGMADPLLIGKYVDIILPVACGGSSLALFGHALKVMSNLRPKIKGLILNKVASYENSYYYYQYRHKGEEDHEIDVKENTEEEDVQGEGEIYIEGEVVKDDDKKKDPPIDDVG